MFTIREIDANDTLEIKKYLRFHGLCNLSFLQLPQWGKIKSDNWNFRLIEVLHKDSIVSVSLVLIRKVFGLKIGYISHGLKLINEYFNEKFYSDYIKDLKQFILSQVDILIIEPAFDYGNQQYFNKLLGESLKLNHFEEYIEQFNPQYTNIIDLKLSEEKIFASFKKDTRNLIRSAQKHNLETIIGNTIDDLNNFYKIMQDLAKEKGYLIRSYNYYKRILEELSKENQASIVTIKLGNKILGSSFLIFCNDVAYELYGGTNNEGKNFNVPRYLKWEDIKYAKRLGYSVYDQCGATLTHTKSIQYQYGKFKAEFSQNFLEALPQHIVAKNNFVKLYFKIMTLVRQIYSKSIKTLKKVFK